MNMVMRTTPPALGRRPRVQRARAHGAKNPYGTPTDTDVENGSETSSADGYFCSPGTPGSAVRQQSWGARNMFSHSANSSVNVSPDKALVGGPNPWLSAIPRSTGFVDIPMTGPWPGKRRADEIDADDEYDGEESGSVTDDKVSVDAEDKGSDLEMEDMRSGAGGVEKKAAFLLMKLSVKDGESSTDSAMEAAGPGGERDLSEGPRVKRRRATSM